MKRSAWRIFAVILMIAAGACFVATVEWLSLDDAQITGRDFIQYWAISQQLIHGANPYDVPAIIALEQSAGLGSGQPRISLSPPTVLFPMLPLGLLRPKTGFIAWSFLLLACLSVANWLLWRLNGRPDSILHLFGYMYGPALVCLMAGQLSIFLLLGVVLFLTFQRSHPALAGAALVPCALKPHLFLLFACVLLSWVIYRRAWRVVAGFTAAMLASCAIPLFFDAHVWQQYFAMMHQTRVLQLFIPTFGVVLRFLINRNATWLQFVPLVAGSAWGLWYFWTRRDHWNWMDQGLLVLLVSDICAPYGYFTDECILLPFILAGMYRAAESRRSLVPLAVINTVALIEVFANVNIISPYYLWTAPAWLAWVFHVSRTQASPGAQASAAGRRDEPV